MRPRAAYTLVEIMVVIALVGVGGGLVFGLVIRGTHRFEDASAVMERRRHAAIAFDLMRRDIRSAKTARAVDSRLELADATGAVVVWETRDERLVRRVDDERVFGFDVERMRIARADSGLVEVLISMPGAGSQRTATSYVAASPRQGGRR